MQLAVKFLILGLPEKPPSCLRLAKFRSAVT